MNVSVVIRAKDEAASIGRTLEILRAQTIESEVIVVDSGSSDDTGEIAREHGASVIWMPAESFTFGGALNTGTEAASAPIVVALSAHAFPKHERWLEAMVDAFDHPKVACAVGGERHPGGGMIDGRLEQDAELLRRYPWSGYSNAAGGFRRELWEQHRFRPDMPGTEDKEWAWHWLQRGYVCVIAPELKVEHAGAAGAQKEPPVLARYDVARGVRPRAPLRERPAQDELPDQGPNGHRLRPFRRTLHSPPTRTASRAMFTGWRNLRAATRKSRSAARSGYGSSSMYMP